MKLETIIDVLGASMNTKLIILRQSILNNTFKAYATYKIELYKKEGRKIDLILKYEKAYKVTDTNALEEIEKEFLKQVFNVYIQQIPNSID